VTRAYAADVPKPRTTTRERILDAALELFVERGVAGTTVSDIERAVGLAAGRGSFYRHFRSKDDVVVPAFERGITRLAAESDAGRAAVPAVDDPVERMRAEYRAHLDAMRRFHPLWVLLLVERDHFPELPRVFANALEMRTWDLHFDRNPMRAIAVAALAGFNELSMLEDLPYRQVPADEFIGALVEVTMQSRTEH
jgi:AcrR family transcriptional regulator